MNPPERPRPESLVTGHEMGGLAPAMNTIVSAPWPLRSPLEVLSANMFQAVPQPSAVEVCHDHLMPVPVRPGEESW